MADSIIGCIVEKNRGTNAIGKYRFQFQFDSGKGDMTQSPIEILASAMTDPADTAEAKSKAITAASSAKSSWISDLAAIPVQESVPSVVGEVTL